MMPSDENGTSLEYEMLAVSSGATGDVCMRPANVELYPVKELFTMRTESVSALSTGAVKPDEKVEFEILSTE
jgi:hypothetical protein